MTGRAHDNLAGAGDRAPAPDERTDRSPAPDKSVRQPPVKEIGGPKGPEPTRYGDWEKGGRCSDF